MFEDQIIYEILPQSFYDGSGRGYGDLKGITAKLPYLQWLGVTKVGITPFYVSEFRDSGYDVADYYRVDPRFGTMADFDELLRTAHDLGLGVILDMVFNHTSDKHEWFQRALAGETKYQNYYIFRDAASSWDPPTNWRSKMGGSAGKYVDHLKKFYLHVFADGQPDLNGRNPEVQDEVAKVLRFGSDKGVDGFRFDVCNLLDKPEVLEDDPVSDGHRFYTNGPNINRYLQFIHQVATQNGENPLLIGEIASARKESAVEYAKPENGELSTILTFLHLKVDYLGGYKWSVMAPDKERYLDIIREGQLYCQDHNVRPGLFINNHDQARALSRFGNDSDRYWFKSGAAIATFMNLLRGIPIIYQGEELGMTNYPFAKIEDFFDVETIGNGVDLQNAKVDQAQILEILQTKARDNARTAMQGNNQARAGFTTSDRNLVLVNPNYLRINAEAQMHDESSLLHFYRRLFAFRRATPAFMSGKIEFFPNSTLMGYQRYENGDQYVVATNGSDLARVVHEFDFTHYEVIINNCAELEPNCLLPGQALVLKRVTPHA